MITRMKRVLAQLGSPPPTLVVYTDKRKAQVTRLLVKGFDGCRIAAAIRTQ